MFAVFGIAETSLSAQAPSELFRWSQAAPMRGIRIRMNPTPRAIRAFPIAGIAISVSPRRRAPHDVVVLPHIYTTTGRRQGTLVRLDRGHLMPPQLPMD